MTPNAMRLNHPDLLLIGVEDTDVEGAELGTGKITRKIAEVLPTGAQMLGVLRHQFLKAPEIPYTSNNSPACAVIRLADPSLRDEAHEAARRHVVRLSSNGADPAICIARLGDVDSEIIAFGVACRGRVLTRAEALALAARRPSVALESLGGDGGGVIGALGSVGLTAHGWCGRFIEVTALNDHPRETTVAALASLGVRLAVLERDAPPPLDEDVVAVPDQYRPVLLGGEPALLVRERAPGRWETDAWPKRHRETPTTAE